MDENNKRFLLELSRKVLNRFVKENDVFHVNEVKDAPDDVKRKGAVFVTLTKQGELRGCIGRCKATQEIYKDVIDNTIHAASQDPRFNPINADELANIKIEISVLSEPKGLEYNDAQDLLNKLSNKMGVIIGWSGHSSIYLPQVWEQLPKKEDFISQLCLKAGLSSDTWKENKIEVMTFTVEKFSEE